MALYVKKLPESNPGGLVRYLFAIFSASITRISSAKTTRNPYIMIVQSQQQATVADGISSFHRNICQLFILVRIRQTQLYLQIGTMVPVLMQKATFVFRKN